MSRNKVSKTAAALAPNEAYIVQDTVSGAYRLQRDNIATYTTYSPDHYTQPSAAKPLKTEYPAESRRQWKWASWGFNDKYPNETIEKLQAVPIAGQAIQLLLKMAFGNGIQYFNESDLKNPEPPKRSYKTEVEAFLKLNPPHKILSAAYGNFYRHNNVFPVFSMDKKGKIVRIEIPDAAHSRFAIQDEQTLEVETLLFSKKFGTVYTPRDEDIIALPLYDDWSPEAFFNSLTTDKFAMHLFGESPARLYYAIQPWSGLLKEKGWLDNSSDAPKLMWAMANNQVVIKYKIGVDEQRFIEMYGNGWLKADFKFEGKSKSDLRNAYWDNIEKMLSGVDNAGKSIKYLFKSDPQTGRVLDDIKIEPIDDKIKKDQWIPNSEYGDRQIVHGLMGDTSLIGLQGSNSALGGNSGSNKREGFNTQISLNTLEQQTVLEIYNFVSVKNGWGVCFQHDHTTHTTINNQESGLVQNPNSPQIQPAQ